MNWPWPNSPNAVYARQQLGSHPPVAQNPPPPYVPPPPPPPPSPPISQLLPPVNFYSNVPFQAAPNGFRQFSSPSPRAHHTGYSNADPPSIPSHYSPPLEQNRSQFQPRYNHQRRWNRRQSVRLKEGRQQNLNASQTRDTSRASSSQQQTNKKQCGGDQTSAQEVLSRLNARLPGSSPADIDAWVSARKANWPSKTNVERKQAAALKRQKAGALDTSRKGSQVRHKSDCTQRDLDTSRNVLSRLNAKLPGSSPEEIEAWVKARKANWPSRRNVERKLAVAAEKEKTNCGINDANSASGAMAKLGDYISSEDDEKVDGKNQKLHANRGKRMRKRQGGRSKDKNSRRKLQVQNSDGKPTLLRMLLEREIRQEQSVLLQAFRHIITKKAFETA